MPKALIIPERAENATPENGWIRATAKEFEEFMTKHPDLVLERKVDCRTAPQGTQCLGPLPCRDGWIYVVYCSGNKDCTDYRKHPC